MIRFDFFRALSRFHFDHTGPFRLETTNDDNNNETIVGQGDCQTLDKMTSAFTKDGVVPDVIDSPPPSVLKLRWGSHELTPGEVRKPAQMKDPPTVTFDAEPGAFYTLLQHDPDAPSRKDPKNGEYQHWMVVNIQGSEIKTGEEVVAYIGAGAPKGTGLHRYVFLLYKQKGKIDTKSLHKIPKNSGQGRAKQKVRDIVKKHHLELVAGNFYSAEWDEYVPILHAQLAGK